MDQAGDKSLNEITVPCLFTFVPLVQTLPIKSCFEMTSGTSKYTAEEPTREAMSGEQLVTRAYPVPDSEEKEGTSGTRSQKNTRAPRCDLVCGSSSTDGYQSENTPHWGRAIMEAASNKHTDIAQQQSARVPGRAPEVSLGCYFKFQKDRASPASSTDFPTPASSRESILSACSDRDASPLSGSRTISPCSPVYSGTFTPSIIPVKKHFLAPGSSLISLPQSCRSSCESLSCPMSPTSGRHRPPLTRLSLLTAILRKGRLPVLSSPVQRPYTPCWPVNKITLSQCSACSAASSVASIPLELSSEFSSSTSIDSQSEAYRDPGRCATAPPLLSKATWHPNQIRNDNVTAVPRWQQLISPPPQSALKSYEKSNSLQQIPQPVCSAIVKSPSPINLHRSYVSVSKPVSPKLKPSLCLSVGDKRSCLSPEPAVELNTGVPRKWIRLPNPSFSKLQSISQQLKTPLSPVNVSPAYSPSPPPARPAPTKPQAIGRRSPRLPRRLSPPRYTRAALTGRPSPHASPSPTPTPPPAPPIRELTPSPSLSLRSTPSPRPGSGISDATDREGKTRKRHKIKSSYKSLAAIPTNTLLLDQQVIDEQVERGGDTARDRGVPLNATETDTRNEMCSPAWLRKESEELYAVIDEILASSVSSTSKAPAVREPQAPVCSLSSNGNDARHTDPHKTKPGVIRAVTSAPRLTAQDHDNKSGRSPFRQFAVPQRLGDSAKEEKTCDSKAQREEPSACDLHITEPEEHVQHPTKHGPPLGASSSFCRAEREPGVFETQL